MFIRMTLTFAAAMLALSSAPVLAAYDGQLATSSTTERKTVCEDTETVVKQQTGRQVCEVPNNRQTNSDDFGSSGNCVAETYDVFVKVPECTTRIYTTKTTRRATCNSGNNSSGCNAYWEVIEEKTTCVTTEGRKC